MYAANNIARGLKNLSVNLGGLICNSRDVEHEGEAVSSFASTIGSSMIAFIPRDKVVRECENLGRTVVEGAPQSPQAAEYRRMAESIMANDRFAIPKPMDPEDLRRMLREKCA